MQKIRVFLFVLACLSAISVSHSVQAENKLPNIVFMFADDLGYTDLSCYGHPYTKTPHLDQLAKQGTRFEQFYVAGVTCSPSRTAFMTGRHSARYVSYPGHFGFGDQVSITELLKQKGYATGHFGKWHIGPETEGVYGIDVYDAASGNKNDNPGGRDRTLYDAAIDYINKHVKENKDQPFYVNIWGHITHFPVNAPDVLVEKFKHIKVNRDDFSKTMQKKFDESLALGANLDDAMQEYVAEVWSMDKCIGDVMKTLDDLGIADNTIVVFSSDHGPAPVKLGSAKSTREFSQNMLGYAGIFRGAKHDQFEGGVRSPFIIRWPGKVKAGRLDTKSVISGLDWLPTLCAITGIKDIPEGVDGEDVTSAWLGQDRIRTSALFWKTNSESSLPSMRKDNWKMHLTKKKGQKGAPTVELYDLSKDPSESKNLASQYPEVASELRKLMDAWVAELPEKYTKSEKKQAKKKEKKNKK